MSANAEQDLVYTVGPHGVITPLITAVIGIPLVVLAGILIIGSGPVDYLYTIVVVGIFFVGLLVTAAMPYSLLARKRAQFTPLGIGNGPAAVKWSEVRAIDAVPTLGGYRTRVKRESGQPFDLLAPAGFWWWRDGRFDRDVAELRAYAEKHGAILEPVKTGNRRPSLTKLAIVLVLAAVVAVGAGLRIGQRGWISPWAPVAVGAPDACRALDAAGLDQVWPSASRDLGGRGSFEPDGFGFSSCRWEIKAGKGVPSYLMILASIDRARSTWLGSASAGAMGTYAIDCAGGPPTESTIGDESCIAGGGSPGTIVVRRANVVVRVVTVAGDGNPDLPTTQTIAAKILAQVRFG
jgi:hypothetical protein